MQRILNEVRRHAFGYSVLAAFVVAGPIVTWQLFPEADPLIGVFGGIAFGIYAALCAVPNKFVE